MQVLLDKMKHDPYWDNTSESYYTLTLIKAQTEGQYYYATVYNQEFALYGFQQQNFTNEQYY